MEHILAALAAGLVLGATGCYYFTHAGATMVSNEVASVKASIVSEVATLKNDVLTALHLSALSAKVQAIPVPPAAPATPHAEGTTTAGGAAA